MSLITSCPSCGTKFRVVADQLRISEGWVRCGRCQEVFDASRALQAVPPAPAPVAVPPAEVAPPAVAPDSAASSPMEAPAAATATGYELPAPPEEDAWLDAPQPADRDPASAATPLQPAAHDVVSAPAEEQMHEPALDAPAASTPDLASDYMPLSMPARDAEPMWDDGQVQAAATEAAPVHERVAAMDPWDDTAAEHAAATTNAAVEPALDAQASSVADAQGGQDVQATAEPVLVDEPVPSFVRDAQRKAWWNQPWIRFLMGVLVMLLPIALLLQIALQERNTLVAWQPQLRPAFEVLCVALECEIQPRREIAAVVITGSSFHQEAQPHHYRLGLSLHNQSETAVETPAVEVTLTDAQDQILVRKILLPAQIGAPLELAAGSEWNGLVPVATQGLHLTVAGYRVLAFYP